MLSFKVLRSLAIPNCICERTNFAVLSQTRNFSEVINLTTREIFKEGDEHEEDAKPFAKQHRANYAYKKLDFNSSLIGQAMMKVKGPKMRKKYGLILLEGKRLIQEAVDAGCKIESIFFSRVEDLNDLDLPKNEENIYKAPYKEMSIWSTLTTPPGVLGIFQKPQSIAESRDSLPLTIICDQIREPGNLGSLIRSCAGVGVRRVLLTTGCTDMWDSKVLRGGAGGHFKVPIRTNVEWGEIEELAMNEESKIHLASPENNDGGSLGRIVPSIPYWEMDFGEHHNFIVIGGETEGLSQSSYEIAARTNGQRLTIPLANNLDSLNSVSAASVIMFEVKKQLIIQTKLLS